MNLQNNVTVQLIVMFHMMRVVPMHVKLILLLKAKNHQYLWIIIKFFKHTDPHQCEIVGGFEFLLTLKAILVNFGVNQGLILTLWDRKSSLQLFFGLIVTLTHRSKQNYLILAIRIIARSIQYIYSKHTKGHQYL